LSVELCNILVTQRNLLNQIVYTMYYIPDLLSMQNKNNWLLMKTQLKGVLARSRLTYVIKG